MRWRKASRSKEEIGPGEGNKKKERVPARFNKARLIEMNVVRDNRYK